MKTLSFASSTRDGGQQPIARRQLTEALSGTNSGGGGARHERDFIRSAAIWAKLARIVAGPLDKLSSPSQIARLA